MSWPWLALICALSLASADAATKAWLQDYSALQLATIRTTLAGLLMLPWLLTLPPLATLPPALWGWLALSIPLELAAMLLYLRAIRDHPLSLTLPYLALTPALVAVLAWPLLGERLSGSGLAGILLVVCGAWLLNAHHARLADWRGWLRPLRAILWEPGSRLMLIVAMLYALTATLGKVAMGSLPPPAFGALYFALLGLCMLAIVGMAGRRAAPLPFWRRPWAVLVVAALNALMVITHFLALRAAEVAYMIAVKRTSMLFGMLYGLLLFGEPGWRRKLPAALLMLAGVALIAVRAG